MKRYTVAQARKQLADVLDETERGHPVVIERRGIRFVLQIEQKRRQRRSRRSVIQIIDPAVARGQWTWAWSSDGLRFAGPKRRS